MRVLLVEDETFLSQGLVAIFKKNGYVTDPVFNGEEALDYALKHEYDIIILDVMLPKLNGFEVLEKIRGHNRSVPILMFSAKDEVDAKIRCLDAGADDYLTKPFATEELLARMRTLTRRKGEVLDENVRYGDLLLLVKKQEISCGENTVKLSLKEFQILQFLMLNPEEILTKERITQKAWGAKLETESNSVEVYISFIRKKLQTIGSTTKIDTVRGTGYELMAVR